MTNLGRLFIASAITSFLIVLIAAGGVWQYRQLVLTAPVLEPLPATQAIMPTLVPTVDPNHLQALEATSADRSLTYQEQISALQTLQTERESAYQAELNNAQVQQQAYQTALAQVEESLTTLNQQITALETALTERQINYPSQLQQAQTQADAQFEQLQGEVTQARQALAQIQLQLGQ